MFVNARSAGLGISIILLLSMVPNCLFASAKDFYPRALQPSLIIHAIGFKHFAPGLTHRCMRSTCEIVGKQRGVYWQFKYEAELLHLIENNCPNENASLLHDLKMRASTEVSDSGREFLITYDVTSPCGDVQLSSKFIDLSIDDRKKVRRWMVSSISNWGICFKGGRGRQCSLSLGEYALPADQKKQLTNDIDDWIASRDVLID